MFRSPRLQCVRDIGLRERLRATALFCVHRQPVFAIGRLVQPSVTGVADQQIVLGLERLEIVVEGINDVAPRRIQKQANLKPVRFLKRRGDRFSVVDGGLKFGEVIVIIRAKDERVLVAKLNICQSL